jgi:hypothetical protein
MVRLCFQKEKFVLKASWGRVRYTNFRPQADIMIEWMNLSVPLERVNEALALSKKLAVVHSVQKLELSAKKKLSSQRKPSSILANTASLLAIQSEVTEALAEYSSFLQKVCLKHLGIAVNDVVELETLSGKRLRGPIVVQQIEFHRGFVDNLMWLRVKGILMEEDFSGRPKLLQSFDVLESTPYRMVKLN